MSIIKQDANGNEIYIKDPNGNEIGLKGKVFAGIILIAVTLLTLVLMIAHWPDRLPPVNEQASTKYYYKLFHVTYVGKNGVRVDSALLQTSKNIAKSKTDTVIQINTNGDTVIKEGDTTIFEKVLTLQRDSNENETKKNDSLENANNLREKLCSKTLVDLNTLLLLLVALAGFLGNMIHIGTSFTTFVGAGKFKRSWLLWYCVKPFTAAGLAVGVYIIFRAGFLNSGDVAASVNLYGVIAIAVLAGLYTDMATQKLKEVFGVIFHSSNTRPDPLSHAPITITSVSPDPLPLGAEMNLVISGNGFENRSLTVKIEGEEIKGVVIKPNAILFKYTAAKEKPEMILYDENKVEILKYKLITATAAEPQVPIEPAATSKVETVSPTTIIVGKETSITVTGTGLNANAIVIKMGDVTISNFTGIDSAITFTYTANEAGTTILLVADNAGKEIYNTAIIATVSNG